VAGGVPLDRLAIGFALAHPFVDVVLSGAATVAQLSSHLAAADAPEVEVGALGGMAEAPEDYWRTRAALPWS
jgi:aryl-alcohol dehydrogenase-like predicted oxidoreductase